MYHMYISFRQRAVSLRKKGYSYNLIREKVPVSKSTLSYWLKEIPYVPNKIVEKRIAKRLLTFVLNRSKQKLESLNLIKSEVKKHLLPLSQRDLHMFGLGIYLGEGTKVASGLRIVNSDPAVIKISLLWLMKIYKVPKNHIFIRLHLYPDLNEIAAISYWSKLTGIPKNQFYVSSIDRRLNKTLSNKRKLPHGTAHVSVKSQGLNQFGVILHRRILTSLDVLFQKFATIVRSKKMRV